MQKTFKLDHAKLAADPRFAEIAGKLSASSVGDAVCVRASVSPTQPVAGPAVMNGFL